MRFILDYAFQRPTTRDAIKIAVILYKRGLLAVLYFPFFLKLFRRKSRAGEENIYGGVSKFITYSSFVKGNLK